MALWRYLTNMQVVPNRGELQECALTMLESSILVSTSPKLNSQMGLLLSGCLLSTSVVCAFSFLMLKIDIIFGTHWPASTVFGWKVLGYFHQFGTMSQKIKFYKYFCWSIFSIKLSSLLSTFNLFVCTIGITVICYQKLQGDQTCLLCFVVIT